MSGLFKPLENAIIYQLMPALIGRGIDDAERQIIALPLRHGRPGLINPQGTAKTEYGQFHDKDTRLLKKIKPFSGIFV